MMTFEDNLGYEWSDAEKAIWLKRYGKGPREMPDADRKAALLEMRREAYQRDRAQRRQKFVEEFSPMNLSNDASSEEPDWLIRNVLVANSPAVIGGAVKSLKSSIATDLAVCLAADQPGKFLGCFDVEECATRVVYLNYEGTESEVKDRFFRAQKAREVNVGGRLHVLQDFPPLDDDAGLDGLQRALELIDNTCVVVIDPVYRAFPNTDFTSPNRGGGPLADVHNVCRECDSMPVFIHHNVKHGRRRGLEALSGSGLAEIAGQWLLIDRLGCFNPETGHSRLRLEIGGRAGHGGRFNLEVVEGRLDDPGGRHWKTTVTPYSAKPAAEQDAEVSNKRKAEGIGKLAEEVLAFIAAHPDSTIRAIRTGFDDKKSHASISKAVEFLVADGKVVAFEVAVRGNRTSGYRIQDVGSTRDLSHVESHEESGGEKKP